MTTDELLRRATRYGTLARHCAVKGRDLLAAHWRQEQMRCLREAEALARPNRAKQVLVSE